MFQTISIYGDSGITCGIQIAVYFMNLENPETQKFLDLSNTNYLGNTNRTWPSHSWFTHMDGGHPANWKSKFLRASIWQCVMFPQLFGREHVHPVVIPAMLLRWLWYLVGWGALLTLSISKSIRKLWRILVLVGWCIPSNKPHEELLIHGSVIPKSVTTYHQNHTSIHIIPLNSTLKYQNISGRTILKQLARLKCGKIPM